MAIHLTSEHADAIHAAALPLAPDRRAAFITQVATTLQNLPEIGPGNLHRIIADAQRAHFGPPRFAETR